MSLPPTSQGAQPPHNHPAAAASPVVENEWSTGLFDCFSDLKNCFITCLCPCITFGQIAEIVDEGATSCRASGALYTLISCLLGCGCIYSCAYRTKMRKQCKLKGTPLLDFLTHCCCEPCALCQEHREFQNRGFDMLIGWEEFEVRGKEAVARVPTAPAVQPMTR